MGAAIAGLAITLPCMQMVVADMQSTVYMAAGVKYATLQEYLYVPWLAQTTVHRQSYGILCTLCT